MALLVLFGEVDERAYVQGTISSIYGSDDDEDEDPTPSDQPLSGRDHGRFVPYVPNGWPSTLVSFRISRISRHDKGNILVDSGSSHNFVHPRVIEKLKLSLTAIRPFRVYVGNGESILCSEKASEAELRIQGHSMRLDLFVLPIHGLDIILGLTWLSSLHRVT